MSNLQITLTKAANIIHANLTDVQLDDVEDAIQSACVKYLEKYQSLDDITVSWLVRVATNILIDTYRRNKKSCSLPPDIVAKNEYIDLIDIKLDSTSDILKEACDEFLYSSKFPEDTG